ncbi:hypothetical protein JT05_07400 [Desulfosporosinus sp. Tol-M]|nr:hypothetical protein JT05_07400 [Desulfosporosinus sp. Tol-M]
MWGRWIRDLSVELHWMGRNIIRRWRLDTPTGVMGILTLISGVFLFVVIGNGISQIFRSFVPWVSGSRVGEVYWQSIGFGIKTSLIFLIFSGSLIIFFLLKLSGRR